VDVLTGSILWHYPWKTKSDVHAADPLVIGHYVFISSDYGQGCALIDFAHNKPKLVWRNKNIASQFSGFIYAHGFIYGNDGAAEKQKGSFRCLDLKTGALLWSTGKSLGSLLACGDQLILLDEKGRLSTAKLDSAAYTETATQQLPKGRYWNPPVITQQRLYVRDHQGNLYCFDMR